MGLVIAARVDLVTPPYFSPKPNPDSSESWGISCDVQVVRWLPLVPSSIALRWWRTYRWHLL
jgi:hypothetical protein